MNNQKPSFASELKLAIMCDKIVKTKWYEFSKRNKMYKEAKAYAKENNIKF